MSAEAPFAGWDDPVAAFLRATLPVESDERKGWNHLCSTAYQIGCMALVALGEATWEVWGAVPRDPPVRPEVLPRWDDVSVAVLWLAQQQNLLEWRMPDGSVPVRRVWTWTITRADAAPPPPPTIAAAHGRGPAHAAPGVMAVLAALGLVSDGAWTAAAWTVLWRCQPREWGMAVPGDPRFASGLERCLATMPVDIRAELARLSAFDDGDRAAEEERIVAAWTALRPTAPPRPLPVLADTARRSLASRQGNQADWLFFRSWRLPDGWLDPAEAALALEVFHDPLAIAMRRATVGRLFPGSDLAEAP